MGIPREVVMKRTFHHFIALPFSLSLSLSLSLSSSSSSLPLSFSLYLCTHGFFTAIYVEAKTGVPPTDRKLKSVECALITTLRKCVLHPLQTKTSNRNSSSDIIIHIILLQIADCGMAVGDPRIG